MPPNIEIAEDHRLATCVGHDLEESKLSNDDLPDFCACCARQI